MANWIYEFENVVHHRGPEVAVVHDGRRVTFDQLNREASSFAHWVARRGIRRVAMYLPNVYEFYVAQFGALKAGASGVPVNYMFAAETIGYVLGDAEAEAVVVLAQDAELAAAAARGTGVREIVSVGPSPHATVTLEEICATHPDVIESAPRDDADLFNLMYTSGTTGRPKGVMKSHRNMSVHIMNLIHVWKLGPASVWLCAGPLYHTSGLESSSLPVLAAGGTVVLIKWQVDRFFEHVHRYKPVGAYIAGSMLADIARYEHPERWDTSSLRFVVGGGAPQNQKDIEAVGRRYGFAFTERLGMTEAGIIFVYPVGRPGVYTPREELPYHVPGVCGKPLYNQVNFRLIDPATQQVMQRGEGELQLKGDSLFQGYWHLPELTRSCFTEDGWFRTGDIVRLADDGHVTHMRRRDELLISGGENVSPRAVEEACASHPDVVEAAAFGLPDERWGQAVCVAVVRAPGSTLDEAELIRYCKESGRLARFEVPKRVFFRDSLPKTPTLSVPRSRLTEEYGGQGGMIDTTSLRSTIDGLRAAGELWETAVPVDPDLELAGLQKRLDGGPPMLFEQVKGYPHARFLVNLFADRGRIDRLFGYSGPQERTRRLAEAIRRPLAPRIVERDQAPVQEVVLTEGIDVDRIIPPIRHTEAEEEATTGSGVSLLAGPAFNGGSHIGYNRLHFRWGDVGTFQVAPGSHLWMAMSRAYRRERLPVTVNFGLPPAVTLAAGGGFDYLVLPYGCDEVGVAGAIGGAPVDLVPAASVPGAFSVAGAEYAIEGWLDPADRRFETRQAEEAGQQGRFPFHPEWAGYMGRAYRAPTLHVTAVTHRRLESRPLLQPMIVHCGEENAIQTSLREAALFELAERLLPGFTRDVHIPFAMTDWGGAIFQVRKASPVDEGYQRNVLSLALSSSRGMRLAVAVDEDIDIYDMDEIMWALTTRVNPQTGIWIPVPGGAGQTFQPSERATAGQGEHKGTTTRFEGGLCIDATVPYGRAAEPFERPRYPVERVDPSRWFPAGAVAAADAARAGWIRLLARHGW